MGETGECLGSHIAVSQIDHVIPNGPSVRALFVGVPGTRGFAYPGNVLNELSFSMFA